MRTLLHVLIALALTCIAIFTVISSWYPKNAAEMFAAGAYVAFASIGQWWMIFMIVRQERKMWRLIWVALLPFSFIWYYFERVRPRRAGASIAHRFQ